MAHTVQVNQSTHQANTAETSVSPTICLLTSTIETTTALTDLKIFYEAYSPIHGYAAPVICILGIIANCLNIIVLTRKNMISPTNVLLTWLAISDGLTMLVYLPYIIIHYHITINKNLPLSFSGANFIMFFAIFSVVVHSISIWLTVSLAVFRFVFIRFPRRGARLCSTYRAKLTVFIVCVVVTLVCIPNSVSYKLDIRTDKNQTNWYVTTRYDTTEYEFLENFNLWIQATLVKLLPCLLLTVLSILLIKQMKDADDRRKKLMNKNNSKAEDDSRRHRKTNRTTRMLVVVVVLFVLTETPQGVLQLIGGLVPKVYTDVYHPLGDLMDTLALFNNGINFVLYCTMSKHFRDTFIKIFLSDLVKATGTRSETQLMNARTTRVSEV